MPSLYKTWVELLESRGALHPETLLYRFLLDGDVDGDAQTIDYGQFLARVKAIATTLQAQGCAGERALLLYPPGIDFIEGFFGCLFAGVIAVPAYPPDPSRLARTLPRLRGIVADAQPRFVLTTAFVASFAEMLMPQAPELAALSWLSTDELDPSAGAAWARPDITEETLAFLQYTSGSTGRPKGVMLTHKNLMYNVRISSERLGLGRPGDHMVSWLPQYHDMGLIGASINPVFNGYGATIMSPMSFLQRPVRWMQAISAFRGTVSAAPNFAYDLVARKIKDDELAALDLSSWRTAVNGAEPVRAEVGERFLARFGPAGFAPTTYTPSYGMAESTLFISSKTKNEVVGTLSVDEAGLRRGEAEPAELGAPGSQRLVSCGKAVDPQEIAVVSLETLTEQPPLRVGEIWLRGQSDAIGYWRREEETRHTFGATLPGRGDGTWLRTGDLGFLDKDGELYVTGRAKDLIIVRGANHYPQDIEATVEACDPAMRPACSAAFTLDVNGEERLIIAAEADPRLLGKGGANTLDELVNVVRAAVAENHGVQPYAVTLLESRSIPKTTSGKIQRHAAKMEYLDGSAKVLGAWTQVAAAEDASAEPEAEQKTSRQIADWLTRAVASMLGVRARDLDPTAPFTQHGLDSLQAVELVGQLEGYLGVSVPTSAIWDHPNILKLAAHYGAGAEAKAEAETLTASAEPIAIVGLGCRLPGAADADGFWAALQAGKDAITAPPSGRWATRLGGFIPGVEDFDPEHFGLSPREARGMDPQQRLLLEVTFEALESAAISPERLAGSDTGVFIGIASSDYALISLADPERADAYSGTGNAHSIAANRLSYLLDLRGPSVAVDTACSSSLVALHLACQALRAGEIRCAIVGGVNLLLSPQATNAFARANMLAADGRCKTFDAAADGYVRGEGCGVVVLERVSTAQECGDRIHALIRGTAVNQDGRSNGLTAPNGVAQQRVIRAALANAGVSPDQVVYVEAHGTGTPLGDPIELGALRAVLGERSTPCAVGSVKTNIGHLEAAAGVASLIKVVLSLQHGEIPGQLHFKRLNPAIELGSLEIADRARPFPEGGVAGVSSFGFGGTNAHAVLSAAPTVTAAEPAPGRAVSLLTLSARSPELLQRLASAVAARLRAEPDAVADICYSLNVGRARLRHRLAVLGKDATDLAERLDDLQRRSPRLVLGEAPPHAPKVAFVFTGQGAQYVGMGRGLYAAEPVFREMIDRCDALLGKLPGGTLRGLLFPEVEDAEASAKLNLTTVTQPALFSLQVALAALWRSWGVRPDVVTGHSVGAYAAAVVAGVLSVEDGLRLVAARGRLMGALPEGGAMAAVRGGEAEVSAALARAGSTIEIAALNGPEETVISGARGALQQAIAALKAEGLRATELSVSHAFHSALMDPMLLEFTQVVSGLKFMEPEAVFVSDHSGEALGLDRLKDPLYWREHLRRAVRFTSALETIGGLEPQLIIEIGPQPVLLGMGKRALPELDAAWLPSLRKGRDDVDTLLLAVAEASARGVAVDWEAFEGARPRRRLPAPTSPTNKRRMWVEEAPRGEQVTALQTVWRVVEREAADLSGDWIVLGDAALIADALAQAGGNIVPEQTLACRGVIDLRPLGGGDAESLLRSTVSEVQALLARPALPLFVVTRLAQAVTPTDLVSPDQAALWGLLRGLASEHPDRLGGIIDLDAEASPALALAELAAADGEQVAWRGGRRHVARLREERLNANPAKIDADGWMLITGGLGGLGQRVAQWLFVQGARHIALLGRGGPSVEALEAIEALRQGGAEVKVFAADVADEAALREVLAQLPNLRGVVHAAGVVDRLPFEGLNAEALDRALRAKVMGARALDNLTRDAELDLFWLFSSISALWGGQGLAAYAAANAFEDGLAALRVASGRPALSLNWGVWAETGMANEAELAELARMGVRGLRPAEALGRLRLLGGAQGQLGVADVDWSRLRPVLDARRPSPLLSELGEAAAATRSTDAAAVAGGGELALRLQAAAPERRRELLIEALRGLVRAVAAMSPDAPVAIDQGFFEMGLDSLMAVELQGRLGLALGRRMPATLLMDQPTLSRLADWLMTELAFDAAVVTVQSVGRSDEPIAIVGMACRLPGAESPEALWRLLTEGQDATREVPADRWDIDAWHDPTAERPGSMIARRGGFISGVDQFDASFFGITGREASRMDPQHRLLLEVSWRALEDAGAVPERGVGTQAGIFVGIGSNDYLQRVIGGRDAADVDAWTGTGNATAFAAGRLAYHLGLQGPAVALDTACSSSLVAAHLACQSLRAGECSLALAAGVNLILDPKVSVYLSRARALAPDGRCKTFDAAADGYARGEGCGVVVLKRLSDALRDGDTIHAVIRGSAINHDGRASGLTVPNGPAQQAVIRQALHSAGVRPEEIGYVEAHGTGTSLGDPIEIGALDAVLGRSHPLVVGTVKTNLGHLEAAAGIAGLIKATLCVERGLIPANLHFHTINPHIDPAIPLQVPTQTQAWAVAPRVAGVSAFGLSGTNAHLILSEAPALDEQAAAARAARPKVEPAVFTPKRYWLDAPAPAAAVSAAPALMPRGAAFLGERLSLPMLNAVVFQAQHSPASPRWLGDHRLFGRVVTPGAAHVALSLEAARVSRGVTSASVVDLSFSRAMVLADDETRALQMVFDGDSGDVAFRIGSLHDGQALVHATGRLLAEAPADEPATESLATIQRRLEPQGPSTPFYAQFDRVGYTLGPRLPLDGRDLAPRR
jgi:acyl transferase domain-containing protein/acyl-CoA synthetase (AMP-forming)/AMP-acid ligase II/acyl carrier protein